MLARFEVIGSCTERGTDGIAAWWSTKSMPLTARWATSRSRQVAFDELHRRQVGQVLHRLPVIRLSTTRTRSPRRSSSSDRCGADESGATGDQIVSTRDPRLS